MIKIELKTIYGGIAFTWESEKNTTKETVTELLKANSGKTIAGIDLSNFDLSKIDFSNSKFDNSKFYNSKFYNSKFYNSKFDNSKFYNSKFDNSKFYNSKFYNSKFYNSKFDNSKFYNSTFDNSTFYNSKFDNSKFDNSKFDNSTFYNSKFDNSKFDNSKFDLETVKCIIESDERSKLNAYRNDFWGGLLLAQNEIPAFKQKLIDGQINGTQYEGTCSCFKGTVADIRGCKYTQLVGMEPDGNSPSERWFYPIKIGDTPENSIICKITLEWIEQLENLLTK